MEWLQKILEGAEIKDEKLNVEALMSAISKEMPKHFVPKEDFNTKVSELKTANDTIKTLKESNQDNETLQKTIKDHEATIKDLQKENENTKKEYALKDALAKEGCANPAYFIFKQGGLEKFSFDKDGAPVGVKELVEPLKADNPLLFPKAGKETHYNPPGGNGPSGKNPFEKDSFNLTEQGKLFRENPEQARAMAAAAGVEI